MFYERFEQLCKQKGVKPGKACTDMGFSRSLAAKWKNQKTKKPSADVLEKMSAYFGISINKILDETLVDELSESQKESPDLPKIEAEDDDFVVLARHIQKIPEKERQRIIKNFRETVDMYLDAMGITDDKEGK